ncbi:hypothetical protein ATCC90586_008239 [Pythium insidiosum]|nr:hypothetical protein ATCC90586_008239 [Pythium insidiosum]
MPPAEKKQRLVPGSMYIPPPPLPVVAAAAAAAAVSATAATASSVSTSTSTTNVAQSTPPTVTKTNSPKRPTQASARGSSTTLVSTTRALNENRQLGELLRSVEGRFRFQPAVEELLLDMANDFVSDVVSFSSRLAKHRRSTVLEAKDMQFCLAKNYGISLPGLGVHNAHPANLEASTPFLPLSSDVLVRSRPTKNSLHMHRIALKRKTMQRVGAKLKKTGVGILKASDSGATGKKLLHRKSTATTTATTK